MQRPLNHTGSTVTKAKYTNTTLSIFGNLFSTTITEKLMAITIRRIETRINPNEEIVLSATRNDKTYNF